MLQLFLSILLVSSFILLPSYSYFTGSSRFNALNDLIFQGLISTFTSKTSKLFLVFLFVGLAYSNVLGNIPLTYTPTQFYSVVITISVCFWTPIVICATLTDFNGFFGHMFPKGAPIWMIVLLPIVEFVSVFLRPLILVVRLCTNLASGHILLFIFSYFTTLLPAASPALAALLAVLYVMEFFISILQAYIFVNLLTLYISDTLEH